MLKKESIYIAGPECFYVNGNELLDAMRRKSEALGFEVTLPNDKALNLENEDLRKNADTIFENCADSMNHSTAIIADLEAFRGAEPDSGTVYELGMAYARGIRCYGYTRDKRPLVWKNQGVALKDGIVLDETGRKLPYGDLPFAPTVIGSTKIVEGDYDDCLRTMMTDMEEEYKQRAMRGVYINHTTAVTDRGDGVHPTVYLSGPERYDANCAESYRKMKELCAQYGLRAVTPLDAAEGVSNIDSEEPYVKAANLFDRYQQHVRNCDAIIANLNDFRGYECCNDVGFECGMGFQLGKKLFGYMDDMTIMKKRIPNMGEENGFRDEKGCNVENFDYPINLMFSSSMPIYEGKFETVIKEIAKQLV